MLRIEQGGGFVPVQYHLTNLPMLSLYGDGLYVTPGAQIEIYPGPALPALVQQRLTPEAIQLLIQAAIDAGLDKDRELHGLDDGLRRPDHDVHADDRRADPHDARCTRSTSTRHQAPTA